MEDWPYSLQELTAAREMLYQTITFLDVTKGHLRNVMPVWHSDFTHKCSCPFHSNGEERTPSFYLSEKTKAYHCFSCSAHGSLISFLSIIQGKPWEFIVRDFLLGSKISGKDIDNIETTSHSYVDFTDISMELNVMLRKHLESCKSKENYAAECEWVDGVFDRIDVRFDDVDLSVDEAKAFKMQVERDLFRHKKFS